MQKDHLTFETYLWVLHIGSTLYIGSACALKGKMVVLCIEYKKCLNIEGYMTVHKGGVHSDTQ